MDKLERYRSLIKEILAENAKFKPSHGEIEPMLVFDDEHQSYQLNWLRWSSPVAPHQSMMTLETWFLAVYKDRFVPDEGSLEPKNQVSMPLTIQCCSTSSPGAYKYYSLTLTAQ